MSFIPAEFTSILSFILLCLFITSKLPLIISLIFSVISNFYLKKNEGITTRIMVILSKLDAVINPQQKLLINDTERQNLFIYTKAMMYIKLVASKTRVKLIESSPVGDGNSFVLLYILSLYFVTDFP